MLRACVPHANSRTRAVAARWRPMVAEATVDCLRAFAAVPSGDAWCPSTVSAAPRRCSWFGRVLLAPVLEPRQLLLAGTGCRRGDRRRPASVDCRSVWRRVVLRPPPPLRRSAAVAANGRTPRQLSNLRSCGLRALAAAEATASCPRVFTVAPSGFSSVCLPGPASAEAVAGHCRLSLPLPRATRCGRPGAPAAPRRCGCCGPGTSRQSSILDSFYQQATAAAEATAGDLQAFTAAPSGGAPCCARCVRCAETLRLPWASHIAPVLEPRQLLPAGSRGRRSDYGDLRALAAAPLGDAWCHPAALAAPKRCEGLGLAPHIGPRTPVTPACRLLPPPKQRVGDPVVHLPPFLWATLHLDSTLAAALSRCGSIESSGD